MRRMKLADWIAKQPRGTVRRLAAREGVREATFYEAARHGLKRLDVAKRLSAVTGGAVSVAELMGLSAEDMPRRGRAA